MLDAIDLYCERTGPEFWAEPVNALTNAFFLLTAWFAWKRARAMQVLTPGTWLLIGLLIAIGIGSFLFHTFANGWSLLADIIPIFLFQMAFLWLYLRDVSRVSQPFRAVCLVALVVAVYAVEHFPRYLNGSLSYAPALVIVLLLGLYHFITKKAEPWILLAGAAALFLSLVFRTIDMALCVTFPPGTHFLWHTCNAVALYLVMRGYLAEKAALRE